VLYKFSTPHIKAGVFICIRKYREKVSLFLVVGLTCTNNLTFHHPLVSSVDVTLFNCSNSTGVIQKFLQAKEFDLSKPWLGFRCLFCRNMFDTSPKRFLNNHNKLTTFWNLEEIVGCHNLPLSNKIMSQL